jgi:uncharacterized protein YigA (DUF484 family)
MLNRLAVALSVIALAVIAYLASPPGFLPKTPAAMRTVANDVADGKPDAASRQRIQQMEAELTALQAEAAKNPARPRVAEMEHELNRMVAERHGDSGIARLERLVRGSLAVSLILALALCGLALLNLRSTRSQPNQPAI